MAVYTDVSDEDLAAFLQCYGVEPAIRKTPIAEGVENTNYLLQTKTSKYILTLFEKRVCEDDLPFFMSLTQHLAAKGLPVPAPLVSSQGETISRLSGKPAALIHFLNGRPHMTPTPNNCGVLGGMLGSLHYHIGDFPLNRANTLSLDGWLMLAEKCQEGADRCASGLAELIRSECRYLEEHWPTDLPGGVVHSDLFPDNVLFTGDDISGVIDFYFSSTDFLAYDLAICINAWCFDGDYQFQAANALEMIAQYMKTRNLTVEEKSTFPLMLRGAALRFLLTRLYDWMNQVEGALVTVKDPLEYRDILTFHRDQYSPSLYGF